MNDHQSGNEPAESTNDYPPLPIPPQAGIAQSKISGDANNKTDTDKSTAKELAREFRWFEGLSLVINAVLAVVGICALLIYSGQLKTMQGTLDEMKRSGQGSTDQTNALIGNMNWLAREMNYARDVAIASGQRNESNAKDALAASIATSRSEQRP